MDNINSWGSYPLQPNKLCEQQHQLQQLAHAQQLHYNQQQLQLANLYSQAMQQPFQQNAYCSANAYALQQMQLNQQLMHQWNQQALLNNNNAYPNMQGSNNMENANVPQSRIEKIYLNDQFVTNDVFKQLQQEIPKLTAHESYEGFFVFPNPTGHEWDMVLKVFHTNQKENKTTIKYYLLHQDFCLRGDRRSDALIQTKLHSDRISDRNCIQIEVEVPEVLFMEFDHIIEYFYGVDITVTDSRLVSLYILVERLRLSGGILKAIELEIRRCCDKRRCIAYLLQAEQLSNEHLTWLCGEAILQNLSSINQESWLCIPLMAFTRLVYQATAPGIEQYSNFIVCELMVKYLKAIMSESHDHAKEVVRHLDIHTDIRKVTVDHSIIILKMCDVLFSEHPQTWRDENIGIYRLALAKISAEFTPYHNELCQQLQGLSPKTFSRILILANHLPQNALNLSLMAYKDANNTVYFKDSKLQISFILKERKEKEEKPKRMHPIDETMDDIKSELKKLDYAISGGERYGTPEIIDMTRQEIEMLHENREFILNPKSPSKSPAYSSLSYEHELSPCSTANHEDDQPMSKDVGRYDIVPNQSPLRGHSRGSVVVVSDATFKRVRDNAECELITKLIGDSSV